LIGIRIYAKERTAALFPLPVETISREISKGSLGEVTPTDSCCVNERVRICAWPLHESDPAEPPTSLKQDKVQTETADATQCREKGPQSFNAASLKYWCQLVIEQDKCKKLVAEV
jgi:hypothetical protein